MSLPICPSCDDNDISTQLREISTLTQSDGINSILGVVYPLGTWIIIYEGNPQTAEVLISANVATANALKHPFANQTTVVIPHGDGKEKIVQVYVNDSEFVGAIAQDINTITVTFNAPQSGYVLYF